MAALSTHEVQKTCKELSIRIRERFPQARLNGTCEELLHVADDILKTNAWIKRPNIFIRSGSWMCIILLVCFIVPAYTSLKVTTSGVNIADFFQMLDSSFNVIVLAGGTGLFLMTFETRQKRKKVISAINKLKCIAHIIDAHQLVKDPKSATERRTASSPMRTLTDYELGRYLDYCSEMLSLIGMIAFLYVQNFDDPIANDSVTDLESLTTGISQKLWQKIIVIDRSSHKKGSVESIEEKEIS
jgi:hypothetical protein